MNDPAIESSSEPASIIAPTISKPALATVTPGRRISRAATYPASCAAAARRSRAISCASLTARRRQNTAGAETIARSGSKRLASSASPSQRAGSAPTPPPPEARSSAAASSAFSGDSPSTYVCHAPTGSRSTSKISACILEMTMVAGPSTGTRTAESQRGHPPGWASSPVSQTKFGPAVTYRPSREASAASARARSNRHSRSIVTRPPTRGSHHGRSRGQSEAWTGQ